MWSIPYFCLTMSSLKHPKDVVLLRSFCWLESALSSSKLALTPRDLTKIRRPSLSTSVRMRRCSANLGHKVDATSHSCTHAFDRARPSRFIERQGGHLVDTPASETIVHAHRSSSAGAGNLVDTYVNHGILGSREKRPELTQASAEESLKGIALHLPRGFSRLRRVTADLSMNKTSFGLHVSEHSSVF